MIIKDARIVLRDRIFDGDLQYDGGRIVKIGKGLGGTDGSISVKGLYILPGAIDSHVHFREPEASAKEDFLTGSSAALSGGVTTIVDMPCYRAPATTTLKALKQKLALAKSKFVCDYAFNFGATAKNFGEVKKASRLCAGLKMFFSETGSEMTLTKSKVIERHFAQLDRKKPVVVHAEDEEALPEDSEGLEPLERAKARGPAAQLLGISKACVLAHGRKLHIAHVTTAEEVQLAKSFANVTCEVTPHHLFLSQKDFVLLGNRAKTNPPLRSEEQRLGLWNRLDMIDTVASDHAPHLLADKDGEKAAAGVPGVETMLPLMLTAVNEGKLSLVRLCQMISAKPAEIFGMKRKGELAPGKDADFLIVDMNEQWRLHQEDLHTKCGWSPFLNYGMTGKIRSVVLRGKEACYEGRILAKPGFGKPAR
ncbi:MAG: dihydroorotase family protein [Candidatus Burarchaeum sp.]|nr:dihydroorotase family protein [Candidatus Burarchaeum sp.]MDO8339132.1 dihydroorotase family protein [Candidatus Burarchaeum sp.]